MSTISELLHSGRYDKQKAEREKKKAEAQETAILAEHLTRVFPLFDQALEGGEIKFGSGSKFPSTAEIKSRYTNHTKVSFYVFRNTSVDIAAIRIKDTLAFRCKQGYQDEGVICHTVEDVATYMAQKILEHECTPPKVLEPEPPKSETGERDSRVIELEEA